MNIADVLFWGGLGGAVLGGLWYGVKTRIEKGRFGPYQGSADGHKSASYAGENGNRARRHDEPSRFTGAEESRATSRGHQDRPDDGSSGGSSSASRRGFNGDLEPDGERAYHESSNSQSLRFEVSELRREIERLARSFDELNSEVTRRINRANARLARAKGQDDQPELPGTQTEETGGLRVKGDLRKLAQARLLARRGFKR